MHKTKEIIGFEFIKVGIFYLADKPRVDKKGEWEIRASLNLFSDEYKKADENVYVVYSDDEPKYVGEYTYNLEDRWLKGNYIYHHKSDKIESEIKSGKEVSLWLAVSPYYVTKGFTINLGKSIEQEILRHHDLDWNKRNKIKQCEEWRQKNCIKVSDIIQKTL
jgi:hypothetical protein